MVVHWVYDALYSFLLKESEDHIISYLVQIDYTKNSKGQENV